jgi:hypothetical protein
LTDQGVARSFTLPSSYQNYPDQDRSCQHKLENPIGAIGEHSLVNDDADYNPEETVGKVFASEFPLTHFPFFFAGAFFPFSGGFTPINARTASSKGMRNAGKIRSLFSPFGIANQSNARD